MQVVIGYDGTAEARGAIEFAARTLRVTSAVVVHVWSDGLGFAAAGPIGTLPVALPDQERELEQSARSLAAEGAAHARAAGLHAITVARRGEDVAGVLHEVADEYDAELLVVGRRHNSLLESALRGSVSTAALRHERRPVLAVPGRDAA